MKLSELIRTVPGVRIRGDFGIEIRGVSTDSRTVCSGGLFMARKGTASHGMDHLREALDRGAAAVLTDRDPEGFPVLSVPVVLVPDARDAIAKVSDAFFGSPSRSLFMAGITGTNGKTTVSCFLESALNACGVPSGVIGTVVNRTGRREIKSDRTTPEPPELHGLLAEMRASERKAAVMEVSSHALELGRVSGIHYDLAVFTNLTHDHLDFHGTMEAYSRAKLRLFTALKPDGLAVVNADDPFAETILKKCEDRVLRYGILNRAEVTGSGLCPVRGGTRFKIAWPEGEREVFLLLPGRHNALNALAAFAACTGIGLPPDSVIRGLEGLDTVPGRMEEVAEGQPFRVWIDYAHTADALRTVLTGVREAVSGRILVVFGCGGNRDREKRPRMGQVVDEGADAAYVTSDNPRMEDPGRIIDEILEGIRTSGGADVVVEPDRARAIEMALRAAGPGDAVLIAGKGHESVQEIGGEIIPFSDRETAARCLCGLSGEWLASGTPCGGKDLQDG